MSCGSLVETWPALFPNGWQLSWELGLRRERLGIEDIEFALVEFVLRRSGAARDDL